MFKISFLNLIIVIFGQFPWLNLAVPAQITITHTYL